MRNSSITDFFQVVKRELDFESAPVDSITPHEIKLEPHCYIKEETDIPFDETNDRDYFSRESCADSGNRTCSIVIERLSDSVVQKYIKREVQFEVTEQKLSNSTNQHENIENIENVNTNIEKKKIDEHGVTRKKNQTISRRGGGRRSDIPVTKFYKSLCLKCNKEYPTRCSLFDCADCKGRLTFECTPCKKQYQTHLGMRIHLLQSCIDRGCYFKCFKCDFSSCVRSYVARHIKKRHSDTLFYDLIKKVKSDNAKADIRNGTEECSKCGKTFGLVTLIKHIQICSGSKDSAENTKESKTEIENVSKQLTDHVFSKDKIVPYCTNCAEESNWDAVGTTEKKKCIKCRTLMSFKCLVCEKQYSSYTGVCQHVVVYHNKKPQWNCSKCDFKTPSVLYLTLHYKRMHNPKVYECARCNMMCRSKGHLNRHRLLCGVERKFHCEHCSYKASQKIYLQRHIINIHPAKDIPLACTKCHKVCKNPNSLRCHLKYCGKKTYYRCAHCPAKYTRKERLIRHLFRIHTPANELACLKCKRTFTNNDTLKKHLVRCGVKNNFKCNMCHYTTYNKRFLNIHVASSHNKRKA